MSEQKVETTPRDLSLDGVGRLEILGASIYVTVTIGLMAVRVVAAVRNESSVSASAWWIGLAVGALSGVIAAFGLRWEWRRRGGRRLMHLASRCLVTHRLPDSFGLRVALLREFERRDKLLNNQRPAIVAAVLWTVVLVLRVASDQSIYNVATALLLWAFFAGAAALSIVERRRWPRLRQLIAELRENPYLIPYFKNTASRR